MMTFTTCARRHMPANACLIAVLFVAAGCGGGAGDERGTRVGVRGAVLLDGEPLSRATIVFRAADGENRVVATGSIVEGFYEIPAERGPLVGRMRVEIRSEMVELLEFQSARSKNTDRGKFNFHINRIPVRYNRQSELTVNVVADSSENKFDFLLHSR